MTHPPLVSIVTPSLNQGRFLRRTLSSITSQTYPHIEHIVVDGGSTDDSLSILQSFADRISWVSEPDDGQADAINKGFAQSRGSLRAYLNSDDVLYPTAVEKIVARFRRRPDCDLIYGRANWIDADDQIIAPYPTAPFTRDRLADDSCICQPAAFWRTELAERIGPFDASLHFCMDYDWWFRADAHGARIEYTEDLLACSRLHEDAKTLASRIPMYHESIAVCRKHRGRVGPGPFLGMWRERLQNSPRAWTRRLSRIPGVVRTLAAAEQWWRSGDR